MKFTRTLLLAAFTLALPLAAQAHKAWLLPSQTVLSAGDGAWITVDGSISNDLFYFNHHALGLEDLAITAPDGSSVAAQNEHTGKWRSTFDVQLGAEGTYQLAIARSGLSASYELDGERKRWRGDAAELDTEIPSAAKNLKVTESLGRIETFVTVGAPSTIKVADKGLDLQAVTHPNDLYAGESATFKLLLDGKPAAGIEVTVIPGGTRYRNAPEVMTVTTGADGAFSIDWPHPGMYWLNASAEDKHTSTPRASERRLGYTATLEVLPQ